MWRRLRSTRPRRIHRAGRGKDSKVAVSRPVRVGSWALTGLFLYMAIESVVPHHYPPLPVRTTVPWPPNEPVYTVPPQYLNPPPVSVVITPVPPASAYYPSYKYTYTYKVTPRTRSSSPAVKTNPNVGKAGAP